MYNTEPFGNVKEKTIYELWNSDSLQRIRAAHLKGDLEGYSDCQNCHAPSPRLATILGSFVVDMYRLRQWIPRAEKMAVFYRVPLFKDR